MVVSEETSRTSSLKARARASQSGRQAGRSCTDVVPLPYIASPSSGSEPRPLVSPRAPSPPPSKRSVGPGWLASRVPFFFLFGFYFQRGIITKERDDMRANAATYDEFVGSGGGVVCFMGDDLFSSCSRTVVSLSTLPRSVVSTCFVPPLRFSIHCVSPLCERGPLRARVPV